MSLFFLSFLAGVLTVLAPCVLPILPVILGGSLGEKSYKKPLVISISLGISVIAFTLLLKASTLLIDIPQDFWKILSGGIIVFFGMTLIFPKVWEWIEIKLRFGNASQSLLSRAGGGTGIKGSIALGAALGPVFASCSPTYFVILATVLPVNFAAGLGYLMVYALGLVLMVFLIGFFGQKMVNRLKGVANPNGWFKKVLGILLVIVGVLIFSGYEKKVEVWLLDNGFNVTRIEQKLLDDMDGNTVKNPYNALDFSAIQRATPDSPLYNVDYIAPKLEGLENWLNHEPITSLDELKGKVVLVDFWTYSCINCIRTLPYVKAWHQSYADDGLVILGIHAPEFQFEKKLENVQKAVQDFGLKYPIVQDNDFKTWRNFDNHYWPAKYLVDKEGFVRYEHFGEGDYEETEEVIVQLLGTKMKSVSSVDTVSRFQKVKTLETYLGSARRENFIRDEEQVLNKNQWKLIGEWKDDDEKVMVTQFPISLIMNFTASEANLVLSGKGVAEIYINGKLLTDFPGLDVKDGKLLIDGSRLYELADFQGDSRERVIEVRFVEGENVEMYAWTFG